MIKHTDLVSIIIPIHNSEEFLDDCLTSVISQTHKNTEVIIINDDSTDDSEKIVREYQKRDKRIKYYRTKQHNAALTRREGIIRSTGKYVCFVDSDDIVHEEYISMLYETLIRSGATIAVCKTAIFMSVDDIKPTQGSNRMCTDDNLLEYFCNHYHWDVGGDYVAQSVWSKIFKRDILEQIDYSVLKTTILEDNYIVPQIFKHAHPQTIASVDSILYYYRQNPHSTMSTALSKMISYGDTEISYPELFETTMDYIKKLYSNHPKVDEYINKVKIEEYYGIAESIVDKNIHMRTLEARVKEVNRENDKLKRALDSIYRSKSYMLSRALRHPIKAVKAILKRMTALKSKT